MTKTNKTVFAVREGGNTVRITGKKRRNGLAL